MLLSLLCRESTRKVSFMLRAGGGRTAGAGAGAKGLWGASAFPISLAADGPFGGPFHPSKSPSAAGDTEKAPGSPWRLEGREESAFGLGAQKGQGPRGGPAC